ncbi:M14 family zinc carboxypeptidase [Blattabacterium cuenoti]|uniref:M14 family zinc carboxypeptidase n=1 Tax=Blattabacterium cuenoti TaxID=1653831 RepID=UPI00163D21EA|nr:M14 family zinc carboxypeptidase [Blattabacterium cuenoti]
MFFFDIRSLFRDYDSFFKDDKISFYKIFSYNDLLELLNNYENMYSQIGFSVEKRKIFRIKWGYGNKKILIWSQMHGNETTGTKSIFDLLHFFSKEENNEIVKFLKKNLTISFIPMLNPDGAEKFQRRNAINIDLNRDVISLQSPEIKILLNEIEKYQPDILFNLHDQRIIYNVSDSFLNPAILSFLSPSVNNSSRTEKISNSRKISMGIIYCMAKEINKILPNVGSISRFSDIIYPTATGDNLQKLGYPCILIEAGNVPKDFHKEIIRKYNTLSIISGLVYSIKDKYIMENYKYYFTIPESKENILYKIYRKVQIHKDKNIFTVDIGLMDVIEKIDFQKKEINSILKIVDIGDLSFHFAYENLMSTGKKFHGVGKEIPEIGDVEHLDFHIY